MVSYDEDGRLGTLRLSFLQVGGQTHVDATADEPVGEPNGWWLVQLAPVHTASKSERFVFTATPPAWVEFLAAHGEDRALSAAKCALRFVRVAAPTAGD